MLSIFKYCSTDYFYLGPVFSGPFWTLCKTARFSFLSVQKYTSTRYNLYLRLQLHAAAENAREARQPLIQTQPPRAAFVRTPLHFRSMVTGSACLVTGDCCEFGINRNRGYVSHAGRLRAHTVRLAVCVSRSASKDLFYHVHYRHCAAIAVVCSIILQVSPMSRVVQLYDIIMIIIVTHHTSVEWKQIFFLIFVFFAVYIVNRVNTDEKVIRVRFPARSVFVLYSNGFVVIISVGREIFRTEVSWSVDRSGLQTSK